MTRALPAAFVMMILAAADAAAQQTIQLQELQAAARATDPRSGTPALIETQSDLRLQNIAALRLPSISVEALAQGQSDAATAPFRLPTGEPAFEAPKVIFDTTIRVEQRILDSTLGAQAAVERAQRAESLARVATSLYAIRQQVNDAFFAAAALEQRRGALRATIEDLRGRLRDAEARVEQGTALHAEAQAVEATLLQRQQDDEELSASRRAALAQLQRLTGRTIAEADTLVLPDLAAAVARVRQQATPQRPELAEFDRVRERLRQQQSLLAAQERPQLSAFGRVGHGKPGLDFTKDVFDTYALGGLQLRWRAWTWNSGSRERAALAVQQQIVAADREAFSRQVARAGEVDVAHIDRLAAALTSDARILELREQIMRVAETRFGEGVITSAEYLDRSAELLQARFARATHQVELAQAQARLLTTLGEQ